MIFIFSCFFFSYYIFFSFFFFFFQAEDGIRDGTVTGVQTCALPISRPAGRETLLLPRQPAALTGGEDLDLDRGAERQRPPPALDRDPDRHQLGDLGVVTGGVLGRQERSEERRVGKECRSRWSS